ncbi:MAG: hypothetical protein ACI8P9_001767 [Parasphingorhabdus sp.]|jgi:hypothetical protein
MGSSFNRFSVVVEVFENLFNDRRIFDTGNNFDCTVAMLTGFNVDVEHAFLSKADVELFVR